MCSLWRPATQLHTDSGATRPVGADGSVRSHSPAPARRAPPRHLVRIVERIICSAKRSSLTCTWRFGSATSPLAWFRRCGRRSVATGHHYLHRRGRRRRRRDRFRAPAVTGRRGGALHLPHVRKREQGRHVPDVLAGKAHAQPHRRGGHGRRPSCRRPPESPPLGSLMNWVARCARVDRRWLVA